MKRYRMTIGDNGAGPSLYSDEDPSGDWVDAEEATAEVTRLRAALGEALDSADEGWSYASDYFRDKWRDDKRLAELRTLAGKET
jgi:hypothetical protein